MSRRGRRLMAPIVIMSLLLLGCDKPGSEIHSSPAPQATAVPQSDSGTPMQSDTSDQSTTLDTQSTGLREDDHPAGDMTRAETSGGSITVEITPLRTDAGIIYGAEARDQASGTLLATAKQAAVSDNLLVVEETQYSPSGQVVYEGKLFFSAGNSLVREERTWGEKRWNVFQSWISDTPGF